MSSPPMTEALPYGGEGALTPRGVAAAERLRSLPSPAAEAELVIPLGEKLARWRRGGLDCKGGEQCAPRHPSDPPLRFPVIPRSPPSRRAMRRVEWELGGCEIARLRRVKGGGGTRGRGLTPSLKRPSYLGVVLWRLE